MSSRSSAGSRTSPFSRRGRRDAILSLTGQKDVPVLLLEDGTTVVGSREIVDWAERTPAASAA